MEPRIIKTKEEYRTFRAEVERLLARNPDVDPDSDHGRRLELLAKLVEDYEKEHVQFRNPSPAYEVSRRPRRRARK